MGETLTYDELMKRISDEPPVADDTQQVQPPVEPTPVEEPSPKAKPLSYAELMTKLEEESSPKAKPLSYAELMTALEEDQGSAIDTGATLKKKDLYKQDNLDAIRNFMSDYRGVDYAKKDDEVIVEDFVDQMRWFNTNMVSTAGMIRHVYNADDNQKATADKAFKIYDKLGNVFVNDGFYGAIDGVTDYIFAAAADPSNYVGALTGGIGKASALGISTAGKEAVKLAATEAGKRVLAKGATQQAALKAGDEAASAMAKRLVSRNITTDTSKDLISRAALQEQRLFLQGAEMRGAKAYTDDLTKTASKRAVMQTFGIDAGLAALHDVQIQNTMMQLDDSIEYNAMQTGFSSLLGSIGAGMQIIGGSAKGISGLGEAAIDLSVNAQRQALTNMEAMVLDKGFVVKAADVLDKTLDTWKDKWTRGKTMFDPSVTPTDLLKDIMLGSDGRGGLAKVFKDSGMKLNSKMTVSDIMTNIVKQLPHAQLKGINEKLSATGIQLGEVTQLGVNLGDLLAKDIRQGAQALNIMSQVRKTIDAGLVQGTEQLDKITRRTDAASILEEAGDPAKKAKLAQYGQNFWRRMLVSSPATSMINVAGFTQFYVANSVADVFSGTAAFSAGLLSAPFSSKTSKEMFRIAGVYKSMVAQKARNLMDPFTTHDAYMSFLSQNKDVEKVLFETVAGGVERSSKRFNIPADAKWFKRTEAVANAANTITGVRIQDSFTKSQMFMNEIDKYVRLKHDMSLMDVLKSGDLSKLDDDVMGRSLDTTMKSVFSKDYTTEEQLPFIAGVAKAVEGFSNIPVIGTILPFGRFMNNVVATGYQWTAGGLVEVASAIVKSEKRNITTVEAFSRSLVGVTSIGLAMHYDEQNSGNGNAWNVVEMGGAKFDVANTYPFSLFKLAGRIGNLRRKGEIVPVELVTDLGKQMGVGQFAKDAQFGNDLNNILDVFLNQDEGARNASLNALYKVTGNLASGVTRPLDFANKLAGYINDTDVAKDVRQAEGFNILSQSSTKYIDNLIELFDDKIDAITGEELRIGARAGQVQDPNPIASIFGIRVLPATTNTEKSYSLAEMKDWTASERSNMPVYDKTFNEILAPNLEKVTRALMRDKRFIEGDLVTRRDMLKGTLSKVQKDIKDYLSGEPGQQGMLAMRRKASGHGNKELRTQALKFLKEKYKYEGGVSEMNFDTLKLFTDYIDYMKDYNNTK